MVFARYYHKFVKYFSKVANPIIYLQKKDKKFLWDDKCEKVFIILKAKLTTTPILKFPNPLKDFIICTNAYGDGIGGILLKEGLVVAYESISLK